MASENKRVLKSAVAKAQLRSRVILGENLTYIEMAQHAVDEAERVVSIRQRVLREAQAKLAFQQKVLKMLIDQDAVTSEGGVKGVEAPSDKKQAGGDDSAAAAASSAKGDKVKQAQSAAQTKKKPARKDVDAEDVDDDAERA